MIAGNVQAGLDADEHRAAGGEVDDGIAEVSILKGERCLAQVIPAAAAVLRAENSVRGRERESPRIVLVLEQSLGAWKATVAERRMGCDQHRCYPECPRPTLRVTR